MILFLEQKDFFEFSVIIGLRLGNYNAPTKTNWTSRETQTIFLRIYNSIYNIKIEHSVDIFVKKTSTPSGKTPQSWTHFRQFTRKGNRSKQTVSLRNGIPPNQETLNITPNELGTDRHKLCTISYVLCTLSKTNMKPEPRTCRNYEKKSTHTLKTSTENMASLYNRMWLCRYVEQTMYMGWVDICRHTWKVIEVMTCNALLFADFQVLLDQLSVCMIHFCTVCSEKNCCLAMSPHKFLRDYFLQYVHTQ